MTQLLQLVLQLFPQMLQHKVMSNLPLPSPPISLPLLLALVSSYYCENKQLLSMFFMILTYCCVQKQLKTYQ